MASKNHSHLRVWNFLVVFHERFHLKIDLVIQSVTYSRVQAELEYLLVRDLEETRFYCVSNSSNDTISPTPIIFTL